MRLLFTLFALALFTALPAWAEALRGDAFITAMDGNTLSAKDENGVAYNMYFLPGGIVTYQDVKGNNESGAWHLDDQGDVCVMWLTPTARDDGCFHVTLNGDMAKWESKSGTHHGGLRGGVSALGMSKTGQ